MPREDSVLDRIGTEDGIVLEDAEGAGGNRRYRPKDSYFNDYGVFLDHDS